MTFNAIHEDITLTFGSNHDISLTGDLIHDPDQHALVLLTTESPQILSINLDDYGLHLDATHPDYVWIKNWSEHAELAKALIDAGVAREIANVFVGPFTSQAILLEVLR